MAQDAPKIKEVKAYARHIHVSPRKLRLLADLVRQTPVDSALQQLKFASKRAAVPLAKVINSAVANAVHNFDLKKEDLFIKSLTVDGGPVIKRYAPRAQGRAFIVRKRTSHINVILESKPKKVKSRRSIFSLRPKTKEVVEQPKTEEVESGTIVENKVKPKQPPKPQERIKKNLVDLKRRLFNRKSGG
jgi:large subunit ribosomal protein L22